MSRRTLRVGLLTLSLSFALGGAMAQLKVYPLFKTNPTAKKKTSARIKQTGPLELPFWDDFSFSLEQPDDSLWVNSENVYVSGGLGIEPITLNVATFDGLRADGSPYNVTDEFADGQTDVLTSDTINMDLDPADTSSVYLSFYCQFDGNGEPPDNIDRLLLEAVAATDTDTTWVVLWELRARDVTLENIFVPYILQIQGEQFFHNAFQFRFRSFGRQSGPFDTWHLDYIYLNTGRSSTDFTLPDRALSIGPSSIFRDYQAIPFEHFIEKGQDNVAGFVAEAYNLHNERQPARFFAIADIFTFEDGSSTLTIDTLQDRKFSSFPEPSTTRRIQLVNDTLLDASLINPLADSARIRLKLILDTGDTDPTDDYLPIYEPIDFRLNDTTETTYLLKDYYAYDDGTAEFGAGLNGSNTFLAYQFELRTDEIDSLIGLDVYFPHIGTSPSNRAIDLMVWSDNNGVPDEVLYSLPRSSVSSPINQLIRYTFDRNVLVNGTFYVGWKQLFPGRLNVGLDRNTDSGDKIFYDIDGTWTQNTDVSGSLMIRPVFGQVEEVIVGNEEPIVPKPFNIYPNPTRGRITIEGEFQDIRILDLQGRDLSRLLQYESDQVLDLTTLKDNLYLLQIQQKEGIITRKIILDRQ